MSTTSANTTHVTADRDVPVIRIVRVGTAAPEGEGDDVALERLVFDDLGDGRTRLTTTLLVDSFEARDGIIATGMEHGVREGYARLEELLAG